ncbi:hypothetical protein VPH35_000671 [Triticum aestivum]
MEMETPAPPLPPVRYYMLDEHDDEEEQWLSPAVASLQPEPLQDQEEDPESEPYPYDERTLYAPRLDPAARRQLQTSLAGNKVKLELTRATRYVSLLNNQGSYHHVNFFTRAMDEEERFFFAELHDQNRRGPGGARIRTPTCLCSLDGEGDGQPWLVPVDYCLACDDEMKHPKDGASYQAGHLYTLHQPGQGKPRVLI